MGYLQTQLRAQAAILASGGTADAPVTTGETAVAAAKVHGAGDSTLHLKGGPKATAPGSASDRARAAIAAAAAKRAG